IHATGVRAVTNYVAHRTHDILARPRIWRADVLMASSVFMLLALHLLETVGYGNFVLPAGWEMLAPIIAMSGLFAFGWSGSVLVDIVARCQRIKDLVT